ncbi:MAG: DUF3618 domain-containing protein [Akkermansiaceae bacterium]|nr:DUF3618 domain-containing protein [Armatimonadota bacterium]
MGETTTLERPDSDVFPPATFEESVVETSPEIEATKANIEHTRAEMSDTINAIKEQLSPKRLVEDAKEAASEAVTEKVTEVKDAVMDKVSDIAHGASDIAHNVVASVTGAAHSIGDKVAELTGNAKDKINDLTHGSDKSDRVGSYPEYASYGAQSRSIRTQTKQAGDVLMDTIKENPVPAALVGVGLGWLLVDAIIKQQKSSTKTLTATTYSGYVPETYGDAGYGATRGTSYGAYTQNTTTYPSVPSTYTTSTYSTTPNTSGVKSAIDQAGDKLSETGEKIGDAVEGAKAKIGDAAHDLQERASDIAYNVQDKAGDASALVSARIAESIRANPIPAAIAGVSVGWLLLDALMKPHKHNQSYVGSNGYYEGDYGATRTTSYGTTGTSGVSSALDQAGNKLSETGEKIGDAIDGAKAKIGDTAHDLQVKASGLASTVQEKAGDATALVQTKASELGGAVQSNARKASDATQDFVTDNPLAAGAIALLVGTVIGLALPATQQENKLMGTYRDQLADQAGQKAQDLLGKVQDVAGDAIDVAKEQLVEGKASAKVQMNEAMGKVQAQLSEAKDKVQSAVETSAKASNLIPT